MTSSLQTQAPHGSVLGALVGDAAGGTLEFLDRAPTPGECEDALLRMPGGGVFNLAPGQFTDDGEMTVTLLHALSRGKGEYVLSEVATGYAEWAASMPFDKGSIVSVNVQTQTVGYEPLCPRFRLCFIGPSPLSFV